MVGQLDAPRLYQAAAVAARNVPASVSRGAAAAGGSIGSLFAGDRRVIVERNLERAGVPLRSDSDRRRAVARCLAHYGRYYADSFRLPSLSREIVDGQFRHNGFEHITEPLDRGEGAILVLPHLGGWEWAGFWLAIQHQFRVTSIVEAIEPPELFEWFKSLRESLGMTITSVGPEAGPVILDSIKSNSIVCLLSDRTVGDTSSVPVEFFGERTLLPAGPATIALRTGAPLLPTAVYFDGPDHFAECRPAVPAVREGKFRDDVQRITQALADELELLIRAAPEQWHVLQPIWPSDYRARGRPVPEKMRGL